MKNPLSSLRALAQREVPVATIATVVVIAAVLATVWLPHREPVDLPLALAALGLALALLVAMQLRSLDQPLVTFGGPVSAVAVAGLMVGTGGADSHYQDVFLVIPLTSALTLPLPRVVVNGTFAFLGAASPLVLDAAGSEFAADLLVDTAVWAAATGVVYVQSARLRRLTEALQRANDFKQTMLRATSHEVRTPLTLIGGVAATLKGRGEQLDAEERRQLVDSLETNAVRLERLLNDLLDVDRLERGALEARTPVEVDLARLVGDVLTEQATPAHTVETRLEPVTAVVDAGQVERVVDNLIVNALRHTPVGSTIRATVREGAGGEAELLVEDDGPGIPDKYKGAVFEAFVQGPDQADSASPGTGLGLSLVEHFVRVNGGHVWVEDAPGGGARFCVRLPGRSQTSPGRDAAGPRP